MFGKIRATVTDIGGMMSHAAIVCREYGLPAVTGTGNATTLDQDRADASRQRLDGRGHDPVLTKSNGVAAKPPPRETES